MFKQLQKTPLLVRCLILLLFLIILLKYVYSAYVLYTPIHNVSQNTQIYSDGWFGFSLKYPEGANVGGSGIPPTYGTSVGVYNDNKLVCSVELYRNKPFHDSYIDQIYPLSTNTTLYNGLEWQKRRIENNSAFYGFKSTVWLTMSDEYMLKVQSHKQTDERYCEGILATVTLTVDQTFPSAKEASDVKNLALTYIQKQYPDKKFLIGSFYRSDNSDRAYVMVSNSTRPKFPEPVYIILEKQNNVWKLIESTDKRP